jgi:phosphoenolpyruvate synthase/pyruvate phosphate dikinase
MGELILSLGSVARRDRHLVGNKAANLALLLQAGFPVPEGICLATDAFDLALRALRGDSFRTRRACTGRSCRGQPGGACRV